MTTADEQNKLLFMKKFIFILAVILFSCSGNGKTIITVWTDKPDFLLFSDLYNQAQDKYIIQVNYVERLHQELKKSAVFPDIVIGNHLTSKTSIKYFQPLDNLFYDEKKREEGIKIDNFYQDSLKTCIINNSIVLLPVSFNLPAFIHKKDESIKMILNLEEIKSEVAKFTKRNSRTMGFSCFWQTEAILYFLAVKNVEFTEGDILTWNAELLHNKLNEIFEWEKSVNSSFKKIHQFTNRYYTAPGYKLINEKRILFDYYSVKDFFTIPSAKRTNIELSWIGSESKEENGKDIVFVDNNVIYFGIHKEVNNRKGAENFAKWFFNHDNQLEMLQKSKSKALKSFGILNGLSSLSTINELVIPQFYEELIGRIPSKESLRFPGVLPPQWPQVKINAILPWFNNKFADISGVKSLPETIETWQKQHLEQN